MRFLCGISHGYGIRKALGNDVCNCNSAKDDILDSMIAMAEVWGATRRRVKH